MFAFQHPQRRALHNEVHARPYESLTSPCVILHWVYETVGVDATRIVAHLAELLKAHHLPAPDLQSSQVTVDLPHFRLRWERHAEFVTYTAWQSSPSTTPLAVAMPLEWLKHAQGRLLSAVEMRVQTSTQTTVFANPNQSIMATIADGRVRVQTDFHISGSGFSVWELVVHEELAVSSQRLGRITKQLLEIETYRMMGLLGLPAAREIGIHLKQFEQDLANISSLIDTAEKSQEPALLERLTKLASQVESLFASHHARLSATSAYMSLVEQRLLDLNEQAVGEHSTIAVFLSRRLTPAVQTCIWAEKRLQAMSERVSRNSNLLRTRVEIEQQEHHKALLSTVTDRQLSQLRLQATVEGLSAVAMSYYAAGIVGYICKAAIPFGWPISVELTTAVSIPVVFLSVIYGLHRVKRAISIQ